MFSIVVAVRVKEYSKSIEEIFTTKHRTWKTWRVRYGTSCNAVSLRLPVMQQAQDRDVFPLNEGPEIT